jgi:hypothetical protein
MRLVGCTFSDVTGIPIAGALMALKFFRGERLDIVERKGTKLLR